MNQLIQQPDSYVNNTTSNSMKKENLSLIEGKFSPEEAREILINIYSTKLNFHERKNFSSQERFGKEDVIALKRIQELKESVDKILDIISEASATNHQVVISSQINIQLITPQK